MTYEYEVFEDSEQTICLRQLFVDKKLVASARASNKKKAAEKVSRAYYKFADQMQEKTQTNCNVFCFAVQLTNSCIFV